MKSNQFKNFSKRTPAFAGVVGGANLSRTMVDSSSVETSNRA